MKKPTERDIVRFLRRLASPRADGGPAAPLSPALIEALSARRLIARTGEGPPVLTEDGRTFLRRRLSGADGFAAQHRSLAEAVIDDGAEGHHRVTVNLDESPLGRLRRHKSGDGTPLIGDAEFVAGERLRSDYSRAAIMPRVTANWSAAVATGRRDGGMAVLTEAVIGARLRVDRALDAVGPEFAGVLVDFCCFLKGIEEIERDRRWPARSAKLVISLALAALARHYGLAATARGAPGPLRHWGSNDYRPTIDGA